ncbi:hypothetical protein [Pseudomonas sp.]|uniref:hypothetical protein n=1 Tax=Pseudomonas sp. TaxID=306 RepID=UPI003FD8F378
MSLLQPGPRLVARSMETIVDPVRANAFERMITSIEQPAVLPPPSHWPPRITRLCLSVRLGITRLLLERKA